MSAGKGYIDRIHIYIYSQEMISLPIPSMGLVYLPMVNVGKYTIHGSYGILMAIFCKHDFMERHNGFCCHCLSSNKLK